MNAVFVYIIKLHKLCSELQKITHVKLHNMPANSDLKTTWPVYKNGSITAGAYHLQV
jgi:hypothetical protein